MVEETPVEETPRPLKEEPEFNPEVRNVLACLNTKNSHYKSVIEDNIPDIKRRVSNSIFKMFFDYYIQYKRFDKEDDFVWKLDKRYTDNNEEKWKSKFLALKDRRSYFDEPTNEEELFLSKDFVNVLKKMYNDFYDDFLKENNKKPERIGKSLEFDVDDNLDGFYSLKNFMKKPENENFQPEDFGLRKFEGSYHIPRGKIDNMDFTDMVLKFSPNVPRFLVNPNNKTDKYNTDNMDVVQKIKIMITKKIEFDGDGMSVKGSYIMICPECATKIEYKPFEMSKNIFQHLCFEKLNSKGLPTNVKWSKSSYIGGASLKMYCYEVTPFIKKDKLEINKQYFFSLDKDIAPGIYITNVVNLAGKLNSPDDNQPKCFILGYKTANPKIIGGLFSPEEGKKLADMFGFPYHKIFDIWAGVIKYYKDYKNIDLNPKKGGTLQLMLIISALTRKLFNNRNLPISVIGDTSISKTYPAKLLTQLMDINSKFTSGAKSQTYAGIYGGINNKLTILGKGRSIFEEGAIGYGMVVFDEASHFFIDPYFNEELKSLQNDTIEIIKVGGDKAQQRFTPCMFSNFTSKYHIGEDINQYQDRSYEGMIIKNYQQILKQIGFTDEYEYHSLNKIDIAIYVKQQNLYLPLQMYENEELRLAISMVRNEKLGKEICWWSGGCTPAQNRFLFDCVVKRDNDITKKAVWSDVESESSNLYEIASLDFMETVREYICGDKYIDLKNIKKNKSSPEYLQYEKIKESINDFIENFNHPFGKDIKLHFLEDNRIDEKLSALVYLTITVCQLINDIDSTELDDATKYFCRILLLKCKTGLTEKQYNLLDNSYTPDEDIIFDKRYTRQASITMVTELEKLNEKEKAEENIREQVEKVLQEKSRGQIEVQTESQNFEIGNYINKDIDEEYEGNPYE